MKSVIKNFVEQLYFFIEYLVRTLLNIKFSISKIKENNKKMLIIGNGPSANLSYINEFVGKDYEVLCVNDFALNTDLFFSLKPRHYVCVDPDYYVDGSHPLFEILNTIDWDMNFICLAYQYPNLCNSNINVIKLNNNIYSGFYNKLIYELARRNKACFGFQNVILAAIYYSLCKKSKITALIGVDNDWHKELSVAENNDVYREYRHFYGIEKLNVTECKQINKGELYKYFYNYYLTLYQYAKYSRYANYIGAKVYNYCMTSFIDVFDKTDIIY